MKFEFGDLYKFMVSLGVILITLSIMTPWLFLKEPFDLYKSEVEIAALSEVAKATVAKRQTTISVIIKIIPWFSLALSMIGLMIIYFGLKNWNRNQKHIDEQTRLEVEIKKQSLRDATIDEIEEKEAAEYADFKVAESNSTNVYLVDSFIGEYSEVESLVYSKFVEAYKHKYEVQHNKMVADVELDILLQGKGFLTKDYIVEVKYIKKGFNFGWLRQSYLKNIYAKSVYSQITKRSPNSLLLIVIEATVYDEEKYSRLLRKLDNETLGRKEKDRVCIIARHELVDIESLELQNKIAIDI